MHPNSDIDQIFGFHTNEVLVSQLTHINRKHESNSNSIYAKVHAPIDDKTLEKTNSH